MRLTQYAKASILLILLLCASLSGFDQKNWQWQPLGVFDGGLNIESGALLCPSNQLVSVDNFVWRKDHLEGREGKWRLQQPLTAASVRYIKTFKTSRGVMYLLYSDGSHLWYTAGLTGTPVELVYGRCNDGSVDSYTSSKFLHGNTIATQKWRTLLGTNENLPILIGNRTRIIAKVLLDTLIELTAVMDTAYVAGTYSIQWSEISPTSMLPVNDVLWIYSNVGKYTWGGSDLGVADSLTGTRYQMSTPYDSVFCQDPYGAVLRFTMSSSGENSVGKYLRLVTNPLAYGHNPLPANHAMYLSYPIVWGASSGNLRTRASAFRPAVSAQYFTMETLVYDSTTKYGVTLDSIRRVAISVGGQYCSNDSAYYLKMYKNWGTDTLLFASGDWFMAPQDINRTIGGTMGWGFTSFTQYIHSLPVVGGFIDTTGNNDAVYVVGDDWNASDLDTCKIWLFRMKREANANDSVGVNFATIFNQLAFEVRSQEPDRVYWSEANLPDSFIAGNVMILEYGKPIIGGGQQAGELILYTEDSRYKIFASNGTFGKERMNGSRGLVATNSFVNIDNIHYGLATDGYWECDGSIPVLVSTSVSSYFTDSINTSRYDLVTAAWDAEQDNIWLSIPRRSSTKNDITLIYHRPTKSWWRQSGGFGAFCYIGDRDFSDSVTMIAGGTDSSTIYGIGGLTDDDVAISGSLRTGYMTYSDNDNAKSVKSLFFDYYSPVVGSLRYELYRLKDGSQSQIDTASFQLKAWSAQKQVNVNQSQTWGRTLQFGLTIPSVSGVWINGVETLVTLRGRIR